MPAGVKARTINDVATDIHKRNRERKKLSEKDDQLKKEIEALKTELIGMADEAQLTQGGFKLITWDIKPKTVPQCTDWDAFHAYIRDKNYFHLLQRRPTVTGCQELWSLGEDIPGIEKFTSREVTVKEK